MNEAQVASVRGALERLEQKKKYWHKELVAAWEKVLAAELAAAQNKDGKEKDGSNSVSPTH